MWLPTLLFLFPFKVKVPSLPRFPCCRSNSILLGEGVYNDNVLDIARQFNVESKDSLSFTEFLSKQQDVFRRINCRDETLFNYFKQTEPIHTNMAEIFNDIIFLLSGEICINNKNEICYFKEDDSQENLNKQSLLLGKVQELLHKIQTLIGSKRCELSDKFQHKLLLKLKKMEQNMNSWSQMSSDTNNYFKQLKIDIDDFNQQWFLQMKQL